ncbi:MAG: sensor histidine kinase [Paracoccaceae bacterium]
MFRIQQQLADYARACLRLFWHRQAMFIGGMLLVAAYVDVTVSLFCYALCLLLEAYDYRVCQGVLAWARLGARPSLQPVRRVVFSAILTVGATSLFPVVVALAEGPGMHLAPLFFLFSAALYAAMNMCQVPRLLRARMMIFYVALLFIPLHDLLVVRPPLTSPLWMQLGVVAFMLFVLNACANKFVANYRRIQSRMGGLRVERDRMSAAYETQSQFVSVVTHELRTPLTSIKASLDLIADADADLPRERVQTLAEIGQRNSARLGSLINDLLDFQKLDAGKMSFDFARIDLAELVSEAVENLRALADEKEVSFALSGLEDVVHVDADEGRLMQVITNVLSNALKFSHAGSAVDVDLCVDGGQVRIAVRDYGIGIPEGSEHTVFAPFAQVELADRKSFGGTGLGMSISRRILERHGGQIEYVSRLGEGTIFTIELDVSQASCATERAGTSGLVFGGMPGVPRGLQVGESGA